MPATISYDDKSKKPYMASEYADMRGIVDFGNLIQFAPYEKGYAFLAVINGAGFMDFETTDNRKQLQEAFIKILEQEFKGLDGIDDITSETMEITDNISTLALISKVNQPTNNQVSMRFTEKSGSLITKYISTFLRFLKDPRTQAKTYGGIAVSQANPTNKVGLVPSFDKEIFNMVYIITDSSCLNVEKAFLVMNAQPTTAAYSDLYNVEKGDIASVEVTVQFNAFTVDGYYANDIAQKYLDAVVCNSIDNDAAAGKINVNSWKKDWTISTGNGKSSASKLAVTNNVIKANI